VFAVFLLIGSLALNFVFTLGYTGAIGDPLSDAPDAVNERFYLGDTGARDKIAIVRVEGVISQSGIAYPIQQLKAAAADKLVKAIVLRIDSPGGTVSASEELYQCVVNLRDDTGRRFPGSGPKPVSVSMGALAASGGYYVATAGNPIAAESVTITGSIGVFAALPNVAGLAERNGVKVELVKAGGIKASGSFFHALAPNERQTWQDTVDHAYDEFLAVIAKGRLGLTPEALRSQVVINKTVPKRDEKGNPEFADGKAVEVPYTRVRADGGTFTSPQAKAFGLIDDIADLPAAVRSAAARAGLTKFKAVTYERTPTLVEQLVGINVKGQTALLNADLTPRLWYLTPGADVGLLTPNP
jgi:protease-4